MKLSSIEYRPCIDGIRALAVIAVLAFHLEKSILPGGFVGVDVFFVISGYLITSILCHQSQSGRMSLLIFYHRRISRIFPLFFLVGFVTLAIASRVYTSQDFASAGALAAASAVSATNFKLMLQGNYFEVTPDSQPYLHFWSLSVEEQFYLFLPLLIHIKHRYGFTRRWLLFTLSILGSISFLLCLLLTKSRPTWAFYLLPSRAWELLAGSILAVSQFELRRWCSFRVDCTLIGLGIILLSFCLITESTEFPGLVALWPVFGTLLLLVNSAEERGLGNRILSSRLLVLIGKISYSLYLCHWPIYCFVDYCFYGESAVVRLVLKVILTPLTSFFSYFWIETPIRRFLNCRVESRSLFLGLSICIGAMFVCGVSIRDRNYIDASFSSVAEGGGFFPSGRNDGSIVLMGDSNGSMYGMVMKSVAERLGVSLNVISVSAGDPLPESALYFRCLEFIVKRKPDVVVLAATWESKLREDPERLRIAVNSILRHSSYVVLLTQPPILPETATREHFRANGVQIIFEKADVAESRRRANEFVSSLRSSRVRVLGTEAFFENEKGEIVMRDGFGRQFFQDRTHLSGRGAELLGEPLSRLLSELLGFTGERAVF